jgi:dihydrofolate reductase
MNAVPADRRPIDRSQRMAKLVYGLLQSLDGYIAGPEGGPEMGDFDEALHRHFNDEMRRVTGSLFGRRMYEVMRYWDEDQPGQDDTGRDFAAAWRAKPKWVVSRTLKSVGPNATLVNEDLETVVRALKAYQAGEIEVAGPELAGSLTALGLIDEYRLYIRPIALGGGGKPFFTGFSGSLRLLSSEQIGKDTIRLAYAPGG